jgi:starch synthase
MKGATECSDLVSTVSPTYALQIREPSYSSGLHYQIDRIKDKMRGILNGIDTCFYNPQTDASLFERYSKNTVELKAHNKAELQKMLNLPVDPSVVLIGMVGRLVKHKGLDLIKEAFDQIMSEKVQLVILGTGDSLYEGFFKDMELKYGSKLKTIVAFNQDLSRKIYGSSDAFLMPSASEPCGLSQMIACRYGSIPIVRETGGLKDSIRDFSLGNGNGYTFANFDSKSMFETIKRVVTDYQEKEEWVKKIIQVMSIDFSWQQSAKRYLEMYEEFKQVRRNTDVN